MTYTPTRIVAILCAALATLSVAACGKGGGDRGYSDLPVTAVEVRLAGGGIGLTGIVVLGHFLLLRHAWFSRYCFKCSGRAWRFGEMAAEYGRNAQQIVSYHDISDARPALAAPAAMARSHGKARVKILRLGLWNADRASRFGARLRGAFHGTGRNCGIPATGSEDY